MLTTVILRPVAKGDLSPIGYSRCAPFPATSPNWANIDEVVGDEFATYNWHSGSGTGETGYSNNKVDNFVVEALASNITPTKVAIRMLARRNSGSGFAMSHLMIGGIQYSGATVPFFGTNVWTEGYFEWLLNPATGLPWTRSDFPLQGGYGLPISGSFGLTTVYCTQWQMEVTGDVGPIWPTGLPIVTRDRSVLGARLIESVKVSGPSVMTAELVDPGFSARVIEPVTVDRTEISVTEVVS